MTRGLDSQETFAPIAKMNTPRILISCEVNFGQELRQLDVKNAWLHDELDDVYMGITPGFSNGTTSGQVCLFWVHCMASSNLHVLDLGDSPRL